jgi:hypothetical protein
MGCGGSKPEPEPEPVPEKRNFKHVSADEMAAIRSKVKQDAVKQAEAPETAQPFKVLSRHAQCPARSSFCSTARLTALAGALLSGAPLFTLGSVASSQRCIDTGCTTATTTTRTTLTT